MWTPWRHRARSSPSACTAELQTAPYGRKTCRSCVRACTSGALGPAVRASRQQFGCWSVRARQRERLRTGHGCTGYRLRTIGWQLSAALCRVNVFWKYLLRAIFVITRASVSELERGLYLPLTAAVGRIPSAEQSLVSGCPWCARPPPPSPPRTKTYAQTACPLNITREPQQPRPARSPAHSRGGSPRRSQRSGGGEHLPLPAAEPYYRVPVLCSTPGR